MRKWWLVLLIVPLCIVGFHLREEARYSRTLRLTSELWYDEGPQLASLAVEARSAAKGDAEGPGESPFPPWSRWTPEIRRKVTDIGLTEAETKSVGDLVVTNFSGSQGAGKRWYYVVPAGVRPEGPWFGVFVMSSEFCCYGHWLSVLRPKLISLSDYSTDATVVIQRVCGEEQHAAGW